MAPEGQQLERLIDVGRAQKVQIVVSEKVDLKELQTVIERVVGLAGCRTCGLVGIDLLFRGGDPIEQQFGDLPGIRTVLIER
jgi:hypothetical protein